MGPSSLTTSVLALCGCAILLATSTYAESAHAHLVETTDLLKTPEHSRESGRCYDLPLKEPRNVTFSMDNRGPRMRITMSTTVCEQEYVRVLKENEHNVIEEPPICTKDIVDSIHITPVPVYDEPHAELATMSREDRSPFVKIRILANMTKRVEYVFVHLDCLEAENIRDNLYCSLKYDPPKKMTNLEKKLNVTQMQPCHSVYFPRGNFEDDEFGEPFNVGYHCLRLYGLAQTMINVTVFPEFCRASMIISSPYEWQVFPGIKHYWQKHDGTRLTYVNKAIIHPDDLKDYWSPILTADLSVPNEVHIRAWAPEGMVVQGLVLAIYQFNLTEKVDSFLISHTSEEPFKWHNVTPGSYYLYAYAEKSDCQLICPDKSNIVVNRQNGLAFVTTGADVQHCKVCPYTMLNLTVPANRLFYSSPQTYYEELYTGVFLFIIIVVVSIVCLYYRVYKPDYTPVRAPAGENMPMEDMANREANLDENVQVNPAFCPEISSDPPTTDTHLDDSELQASTDSVHQPLLAEDEDEPSKEPSTVNL